MAPPIPASVDDRIEARRTRSRKQLGSIAAHGPTARRRDRRSTAAKAGSCRAGDCRPRASRRWARRSSSCCATTPACGRRSWCRRTSRATTAKACAAAARFLELARDPEIVELVSGVLGDDVILWGCHVFCKPAARRLRDAVAPGRPLLADPSARELHRVGRARAFDRRERLPARHPRLARRARAARAPARGPHRPDPQPAHGRRHLRRGRGGRHRARAGPDVAARRLHDPRRATRTPRRSAAPAWRCATCRRPRCSSATCGRPTARPACRGRLRAPAALAACKGRDRSGRNDFEVGHRPLSLRPAAGTARPRHRRGAPARGAARSGGEGARRYGRAIVITGEVQVSQCAGLSRRRAPSAPTS